MPRTNRLLDQLPASDREAVLSGCEAVELLSGAVLAEPGKKIRDIYFPIGSVVSLLVPAKPKAALEVGLVGNEGVWGAPVALGVEISPVRAVVAGGGQAWRMREAEFRREVARLASLRNCLNHYIYQTMAQLMQTASCNRFHFIEQRVARRLLMAADREHSSSFELTHEFLAYVLGVRRVGVTEAASKLQDRKLIVYKRGLVTITDRKGLERASCPCYRWDVFD